MKSASPVEELIFYQNSKVSSISSPSMGSNTTDSESQDQLIATILSSKAGRPKGSTMQKKREDINNYKECVNAITEEYHNKLTFHKENQRWLMKGHLEAIIEQKKEEFGVSNDIPAATIRTRIKRGSLAPTHPGTSPPLLNVEMTLVEICIQMGKICQPLTCDEAIAIMNDMIRKTEMAESLTQFQKVHTSNSGSLGLVGRNWSQGFKK